MIATLTDKIRFIESVFGSGKLARNSKNFDVRCPICAPKDPTKKKLAILLEDDRCHCWTCGYKSASLAPLIRKYAGLEKLAEYRDKFMSEAQKAWKSRCLVIDADEPQQLTLPKDFRLLAVASGSDPDVRAMKRYLTERGVSERDLWYFKLGYSSEFRWQRRIIVPSFDAQGKLNYYVGRTIDKNRKPKYDNPDVDKLPVIFNELNVDWTQRLVLCEGAFDMFKCGDNAVPLLGSDLNEESALFNSILVHSTPIAMALDADMWMTKTPKIAKKLAEYDIDVRLVDTRPFSDPGQATKVQFKEALEAAREFTWRDALFTKLDGVSRMSLRF